MKVNKPRRQTDGRAPLREAALVEELAPDLDAAYAELLARGAGPANATL